MTTAKPASRPDEGSRTGRTPRRFPDGTWWWVALVMLIAGFASIALDTVYHFADSPLDGPFQLYNGLRRIVAGQQLGGSFQVFHGPGVPYLHLIPFLIMGGDFLASEFSRQIVSVGAAMAILLSFFRAWTGNWRTAVKLSVIALIALVPLRLHALQFPINSMIGLRATMPLVIGIHFLIRGSTPRAAIERAGLFALALAFGIEQGMAAIAGFAVLSVILAVLRREWRGLGVAAGAVIGGVVLYVLLVAALSPSGVGSILRYNLAQVPKDQFWYFGAPPNPFLGEWRQLFLFAGWPFWTLLVIAMVVYVSRRLISIVGAADAPARAAEGFLMIYALISTVSMLGTYSMVYLEPAVRVSLFIVIVAAHRWWTRRRDAVAVSPIVRRHPELAIALLLTFISFLVLPFASIAVIRTPLHMVVAHVFGGEGPALSREWATTEAGGLELLAGIERKVGHRPVMWSTYSSLIEARAGLFHPSYDYIIHALGPGSRQQYADAFVASRPDLVQTLDPTFTPYEEWLTIHHWNFYRPLLRDYRVTAAGPWSVFWTRADTALDERPTLVGGGVVPKGQLGIQIDGRGVPRDSLGLFEVELYYHARNPLGKLPVIGSFPRYLVMIGGAANHVPVSLAPYETVKRFPLVTFGPTDIRLLGSVQSLLPGASLEFDSLRVVRLRLADDNVRWAVQFVRGYKDPMAASR